MCKLYNIERFYCIFIHKDTAIYTEKRRLFWINEEKIFVKLACVIITNIK